jgi:hypothetical protein
MQYPSEEWEKAIKEWERAFGAGNVIVGEACIEKYGKTTFSHRNVVYGGLKVSNTSQVVDAVHKPLGMASRSIP